MRLPRRKPRRPRSATARASAFGSIRNSPALCAPARSGNGVRTGPGQRQLTITPVPAVSAQSASDSDRNPALLA
jgi:hypothetical protein